MKLATLLLEDTTTTTPRPTIFVDLDGVLADFDAKVEELVGPDWKKMPDKDLWKFLKDNYQNFFALLDKMPQGAQLWKGILELAKKANYDVKILTAIPRRSSVPSAEKDKIEWFKKHYSAKHEVKIGPFSGDKWKHVKTSYDILIDDRADNIKDWEEKGKAIGIQFLSTDQALNELERVLPKKLDEALEPEKKEKYAKWKKLVNMSASEIEKFMDTQLGKEAGLSRKEAREAGGIKTGRDSARAIIRMKRTPVEDWSPNDWQWASRQISFISRMRGNIGKLRDEEGKPTRKLTSLLIWGHNPEK